MKHISLAFFATLAISSPLSYASKLGQRRAKPPDGQLTDSDKQALLDIHNEHRSKTALGQTEGQPMATNMLELIYDDDIAATAKTWADRCKFEHDLTSGFGENLYVAGSTIDNLDTIDHLVDGVGQWYIEYKEYTFTSEFCAHGECGHYTQEVWATSRRMGCAYQECPGATFGAPFEILLVCRYSPPGNFVGDHPYLDTTNPAMVASECPQGFTGDASSGLCKLDPNGVTLPPVSSPVVAFEEGGNTGTPGSTLCKLKKLLTRR